MLDLQVFLFMAQEPLQFYHELSLKNQQKLSKQEQAP